MASILVSPQGTVGHDICQVLPLGSDIHNLVGSQKLQHDLSHKYLQSLAESLSNNAPTLKDSAR